MAKDSLDRFIQSASYEPERHYIPCSLPSVNNAIDCKQGFRSGRILEIVGLYSTGKTTLALDLIKNAQALGKKALFVDVERTFDNEYAQSCGVSLEQLDILRADTAENTLTLIERGASEYGIIVLDSLPALVPKEELDKDYNDNAKMAAVGSLLTRFYKRIVPLVDSENILLVTLNQYRANFSTISRVEKKPYGANASHHAITWRLELARVKNEEDTATVQAKITKNKLGKERGMAEYDIIYGKGLDIKGDILTNAVRQGIVTQKGAWYVWGEVKAQGADKAKELFDFDTLKAQLL
jgi:recombination protein RecA